MLERQPHIAKIHYTFLRYHSSWKPLRHPTLKLIILVGIQLYRAEETKSSSTQVALTARDISGVKPIIMSLLASYPSTTTSSSHFFPHASSYREVGSDLKVGENGAKSDPTRRTLFRYFGS
jgi:hypothetical protein